MPPVSPPARFTSRVRNGRITTTRPHRPEVYPDVYPDQVSTCTPAPKRTRSTWLSRRDSTSESGDDGDPPLRRKSSLFASFLNLQRTPSSPYRDPYWIPHSRRSEPPPDTRTEPRKIRRSSLQRFKDMFMRKSKNGARRQATSSSAYSIDQDPGSPSPIEHVAYQASGPEPDMDMVYMTGAAEYGFGRLYQNQSIVTVDVIPLNGSRITYRRLPSNASNASIPLDSEYSNTGPWTTEDPLVLTSSTNAEAGVPLEDPHRWENLNGYSPPPIPKRARPISYITPLPNLSRTRRLYGQCASQPPLHSNDPEASDSNAPTRTFSLSHSEFYSMNRPSNPSPYSAPPDYWLRSSSSSLPAHDMGALPLAPSSLNGETSAPTLFPPYTTSNNSSANSSILHTPSIFYYHPSPLLEPSPLTLRTSSFTSSTPTSSTQSLRPLFYPPPPPPPPTTSAEHALKPHFSMPEMRRSMDTVKDTASMQGEYCLRRMSTTISDALDEMCIQGDSEGRVDGYDWAGLRGGEGIGRAR